MYVVTATSACITLKGKNNPCHMALEFEARHARDLMESNPENHFAFKNISYTSISRLYHERTESCKNYCFAHLTLYYILTLIKS